MKIRIEGLDELRRKWGGSEASFKSAFRTAMDRSVKYVHEEIPPYPAPPAGSTYTRTMQLDRSIGTEVRSVGSDFIGTIGTNLIYAPYVISTEKVDARGPQAKVHRGRWWTLQGVLEKAKGQVQRIFTQTFEQWVKKL